MSEKRKLNKSKVFMLIVCISFFMATVVFGSVAYARFTTSSEIHYSAARVALNVFGESINLPLTLNSITKPGDFQEFEFEVVNFYQNGIDVEYAEVEMHYSITITDLGNLPLSYTLTSTSIDYGTATSGINGTDGILPAATICTHEYKLRIEWPITENSLDNAGQLEYICLVITGIQEN